MSQYSPKIGLYRFGDITALFDQSFFPQLFKRGINYPMKSAVLAHSLFKSKLKYVPTQIIQNAELYYFGKYHTNVNHSRLQLWCSCLTSHLVTNGVANSLVCICNNDGKDTITIM